MNPDRTIRILVGDNPDEVRSLDDPTDATVKAVLESVRADVFNRIASLRTELGIWVEGNAWMRRSMKISKASMARDLIAIDATLATYCSALRTAFGPSGALGRTGDVFAAVRAIKDEVAAA